MSGGKEVVSVGCCFFGILLLLLLLLRACVRACVCMRVCACVSPSSLTPLKCCCVMCTEEEEKLPGFSFFSQTQTQMKLAFVFLFVRSFVRCHHSLTKAYTYKGTPPQTRSKPFKSFAHFVIHGKEKKTQKKKEKKHETRARAHTHTKEKSKKSKKTTKEQHLRQFMEPPTSTKMNENQSSIHTLVEFPPRNASLSTSMTRPPFSRTVCAALRPARPPPMTMTCLDIIDVYYPPNIIFRRTQSSDCL